MLFKFNKLIFIILLAISLLLISSLLFIYHSFQPREAAENRARDEVFSLKINNANINIELADVAEERARGLSGRSNINESDGMLFVFNEPDFYSFWMRDMIFSIDIIWIDENYKIIDIARNVSPDSFPQKFQPQKMAKYVLEVGAGFSDRHNIKVVDKVENIIW